jgi:hypothetical protein
MSYNNNITTMLQSINAAIYQWLGSPTMFALLCSNGNINNYSIEGSDQVCKYSLSCLLIIIMINIWVHENSNYKKWKVAFNINCYMLYMFKEVMLSSVWHGKWHFNFCVSNQYTFPVLLCCNLSHSLERRHWHLLTVCSVRP